MVFSPEKLVIGCAVSDPWASRQCTRVLETAGASVVRVPPETLDLPITLSEFSACVYDLAPWDADVPLRLRRLRDARPDMPLLFYLPPSTDAVAMVPDCGRLPNIRCCLQLRLYDEIRRFERDAQWLIRSVPVRGLLEELNASNPDASPIFHVFCSVVLRRLSMGLRCTVKQVGRELGVSPRTVQRHLALNLLGTPKQLIDRITVWYIESLRGSSGVSTARAARGIGLLPCEVYRLKKRVLASLASSPSPARMAWKAMMSERPGDLRADRHAQSRVSMSITRRKRHVGRPASVGERIELR